MLHELVKKISGLYLGDKVDSIAGVASVMNNKVASHELRVNLNDVEGDEQADPKHHGGADRVLHHFPREHYGQYARWDMTQELRDAPAMGENISSVGLNETQVHIGDIIKIGEVKLQVTQPRSPCFKLNGQFGHPKFALAMQTSGLCGWFYRVLEPGTIKNSDSISLVERLSDISVAEAMRIYFLPEFDEAAYRRLMACPGLAVSWQQSLSRRIEHQTIENWQMRLYGPK